MTLEAFNALAPPAAADALRHCCGSAAWAARMAAARPFASLDAMLVTGDVIWAAIAESDRREAFAAHPRIGERAGATGAAGTAGWAGKEQSGVAVASATVLDRLATKNREYEARFGYIFIVCATGRSADEMLAMLERRLTNDAPAEIGVAAEEQRKITQLRLRKLLAETGES